MNGTQFKQVILPTASKAYPMAIRLLGQSDAAKDAVQQGLLKLWENRTTLEKCQNKTAFVFTVIRNICLDELKRKRPLYMEDISQVKPKFQDQTRINEDEEAVLLVRKSIGTLPEIQREVISMRDIDGLDFDEIAQILNIEISYARVLLSRARKQVREQLQKWYTYESISS